MDNIYHSIIESLVFASDEPISASEIIEAIKEIDGDDKYDNMHILKRKNQFNRPTFSDLSAGEIREKAQSNLRKIKGEKDKALAWRRRWIHWDLNKYTVLFENKG